MYRLISQPNLVKSERSKYLWIQENMPDLSEHKIWPEHASLHAWTLCSCMHRPIYQPNWVQSERSRYLQNQEIILDLSDHVIWPEHAILHACTLCASMHRPIPHLNWIRSERSKYLWDQENMQDVSAHVTWAHKLACMHSIFLPAWTQILPYFVRDMGLSTQAHNVHANKFAC